MQFAEVFLRLGCSLVGWMLVFTYALWLAALHAMGCGPDGDAMHRLLLGLAPFTIAMALLLRLTRPFADIHRMLSRLGLPLALLLPFAVKNIWTVFDRSNLGGLAICTADAPPTVHQIWAPAQFLAVVVIALLVIRVWRDARVAKA